jgi:hypothetical protein
VRVQLREQKQGGVAAVVVLPTSLLATAPAAAIPTTAPAASATQSFSLPGADAEANSNVLPGRTQQGGDPLVALAEKTVREAEAEPETETETPAGMGETPAETTMELLLPEPQGEADGEQEERERREPAGDTAPEPAATGGEAASPEPADAPEPAASPEPADAESEAEHTRVPDEPEELVTDKGLPKRTPKLTSPAPAPRQRTGSVDAEALRRRLGGFRRGAEAGYRDVEAEIAEQTAQNKAPAPQPAHAHAEEDTGGTVEEASS